LGKMNNLKINSMGKETIEEVAERLYPIKIESCMEGKIDVNSYERNLFIEGAKWQQERSYSEQEVIKIVEKSRETGLTAEFLLLTEQFLKK